jgi:retron-type reverse transcriptase
VSESKSQVKPFGISKRVVWEAYLRVKANKGAAGVDGQTIEQYEQNLKNNLFKLWNRLSSGSYFPPPVKAVTIPKAGGGSRILGVPTVDDRIAQTVAAMYLERQVEPLSPRLLWLPSGTVGVGRGWTLQGAVLAKRLGDRS